MRPVRSAGSSGWEGSTGPEAGLASAVSTSVGSEIESGGAVRSSSVGVCGLPGGCGLPVTRYSHRSTSVGVPGPENASGTVVCSGGTAGAPPDAVLRMNSSPRPSITVPSVTVIVTCTSVAPDAGGLTWIEGIRPQTTPRPNSRSSAIGKSLPCSACSHRMFSASATVSAPCRTSQLGL